MSIIENKLNQSLGLGLENIAEVPVAKVDDFDEFGAPIDSVLSDGTPTPEADVVELEIVYDEAHTGAEELEELAEAAQGIESIYNAMVEANKEGGLTPQAAKYASLALEAYGVKYSIDAQEMGVASLESFDANQVDATTVSMEGVLDTLTKWWDAVLNKLSSVLQQINKYYQENIASAGRLKKRAQAIKQKAATATGTKDKETISDKGLFKSLNIKGGTPTVAELVKGIKDGGVAARYALTDDRLAEKLETEVFAKAEDYTGADIAVSAGNVNKLADQLINQKPNTSNLAGIKVDNKQADNGVMKGIVNLPGNAAIVWGLNESLDNDNVTPVKLLQSFTYKIVPQVAKSEKTGSKELPALSASEVDTVCSAVLDNLDQVINNKSDKSDHVKLVGSIRNAGNKYFKDVKKNNKELKGDAKALLNASVNAAKEVRRGNAQVLRYNLKTAKNALSYCSKSLKNLKATDTSSDAE